MGKNFKNTPLIALVGGLALIAGLFLLAANSEGDGAVVMFVLLAPFLGLTGIAFALWGGITLLVRIFKKA